MLLFNEGQRPLLEFLRNLTPQVLLATTTIWAGVRLDFQRWDWSNWALTFTFFGCAVLLLLAFIVNMNLFLDALLEALGSYGRLARRLRNRGVHQRTAALATLQVMLRRRPTLFFDFLASVAIIDLSLIATAIAAFNTARAALR